jgi:hypothetical protein
MGLDEDDWKLARGDSWIRRDKRKGSEDGPVLTGDPEIDKLERELWERTRKAKKEKKKGRRGA